MKSARRRSTHRQLYRCIMSDPLYELLAFKVLSWGVPRHQKMRYLCDNKPTIFPSKYCRRSGIVTGRRVSQSHTSTCPRKHRSGIPRADIHTLHHMEQLRNTFLCSCSWYAVQCRTVFLLMTREIWCPPQKCFISFQLTCIKKACQRWLILTTFHQF